MTPEEAQQAETVEGVREALKDGGYIMDWEDVAAKLLIIVDSQTQKIAEQTEKIQSFSDEFIAMLTVERELQGKLADQSQKIEAMQKQLNAYSLLTAAVSLMQKQYTEEEMRHAFEDPENRDPVHDSEVERNEHGEYKDRLVEVAWFNFMRCARFLGAIKEKEE